MSHLCLSSYTGIHPHLLDEVKALTKAPRIKGVGGGDMLAVAADATQRIGLMSDDGC